MQQRDHLIGVGVPSRADIHLRSRRLHANASPTAPAQSDAR